MNEKIENNIEQILNYLQEGVETAGSFVVEQTPLLIQEILTYNLIFHGILVGFGILIAVTLISITLYVLPKLDRNNVDQVMTFIIGNLLGWGASIALIFCNVFAAIKIYFAPRLYLLEYVSDLIK